ncbi:MAG: DUF1566 domain-containing protein [Ferruginibacter sp.]
MSNLKTGDEFKGGIIFYLDEEGKCGLIVSKLDLSGTADWDEAVQFCNDYRAGDFDDWRLPTKEELNLLYENKSIVGNYERFSYWSCTEYAEHFAWFQNFYNGIQDNDFKDNTCYVRAIRAF